MKMKIFFSQGLINSYELESKKAKYPRIILHENLLNILKIMFETQQDDMTLLGVDKMLVCDSNSTIFINPFNKYETLERYVKQDRFKELVKKERGITLTDEDIELSRIIDRNLQTRILKNVNTQISSCRNEAEIDYNKLNKFLWIKEFIEWNQEPKSSKKFEQLNYSHLN